ncbi:MAG TPA: hypothetical protein VFZ16_20620 [Hyphomicrobiaceae bacterium]|nr:hypothetical protein [Hyphomicrobiaceae bacterium]
MQDHKDHGQDALPGRVSAQEQQERAQQDWERRRRMRSIAIALALAALVLIFYIATITWLGGNVANRKI